MAIDKGDAGWRVGEVRRVVKKPVKTGLLMEERLKGALRR